MIRRMSRGRKEKDRNPLSFLANISSRWVIKITFLVSSFTTIVLFLLLHQLLFQKIDEWALVGKIKRSAVSD